MKKVILFVIGLLCLLTVGNVQAQCTFSDVPESHNFYDYITGMCELGITTGYSDGTFRPGNNVTRGQMSAFVMRAIDLLQPALSENFEAFASGSLISYGPPGCETTDTGCTVVTQGTVTGNVIREGTFNYAATILWLSSFPNGGGGSCAPASGTLTLTAANGSTLVVQSVGILCEIGASGINKFSFNGSYLITNGTGDFTGATGTGIQISSLDGSSGDALGFAHGIFKR
jgi:hypothetical protein